MEKGKNQLFLVVTLVISGLISLTSGATPVPIPEDQVVDISLLEPDPFVIYKVRHYQGQRWKNVLIPPGRDPNIRPDDITVEIGEANLPQLEPNIPPDDVERKKRSFGSMSRLFNRS